MATRSSSRSGRSGANGAQVKRPIGVYAGQGSILVTPDSPGPVRAPLWFATRDGNVSLNLSAADAERVYSDSEHVQGRRAGDAEARRRAVPVGAQGFARRRERRGYGRRRGEVRLRAGDEARVQPPAAASAAQAATAAAAKRRRPPPPPAPVAKPQKAGPRLADRMAAQAKPETAPQRPTGLGRYFGGAKPPEDAPATTPPSAMKGGGGGARAAGADLAAFLAEALRLRAAAHRRRAALGRPRAVDHLVRPDRPARPRADKDTVTPPVPGALQQYVVPFQGSRFSSRIAASRRSP